MKQTRVKYKVLYKGGMQNWTFKTWKEFKEEDILEHAKSVSKFYGVKKEDIIEVIITDKKVKDYGFKWKIRQLIR